MKNRRWESIISLTAAVIPVVVASAIYFVISKSKKNKKTGNKSGSIGKNDSRSSFDQFSAPISWTALGIDQPVVIAMVGLPARGKSYIVKMIIRYLNWTGYEADVFNVGSYRRKIGLAGADANFFDMSNKESKKIREDMAMAVQEFMYEWLKSGNAE